MSWTVIHGSDMALVKESFNREQKNTFPRDVKRPYIVIQLHNSYENDKEMVAGILTELLNPKLKPDIRIEKNEKTENYALDLQTIDAKRITIKYNGYIAHWTLIYGDYFIDERTENINFLNFYNNLSKIYLGPKTKKIIIDGAFEKLCEIHTAETNVLDEIWFQNWRPISENLSLKTKVLVFMDSTFSKNLDLTETNFEELILSRVVGGAVIKLPKQVKKITVHGRCDIKLDKTNIKPSRITNPCKNPTPHKRTMRRVQKRAVLERLGIIPTTKVR